MPEARRASVVSLGCSKNRVDTEFLMGTLAGAGWSFDAGPEAADLIVVNTCAFLDSAVAEAAETIDEMLAARRPGARVVVAGCLVNRLGARLSRRFPGVDLAMRPGGYGAFGHWLEGAGTNSAASGRGRGYLPSGDAGRLVTTGAWAYLKISDGCDNHCGYCLIPRLRGRHRNRSATSIADEVVELSRRGVREINLVGQDITRWRGRGGAGLADLVERLATLPVDIRLRLLYLHPTRVDDRLIDVMAGRPHVWPYADIPIQHADDRILHLMGRPYGRRSLSGLLDRLRRRIPGIALRTTVMVGYPGERKDAFDRLRRFLRDNPFENLGVFVFSPQPGTPAFDLPGRVDPETAAERYHLIMEDQVSRAARLWRGRRGEEVEAILIERIEGERHAWMARTSWQAPEVDGWTKLRGRGAPGILVRARITGSHAYDLEGNIEARPGVRRDLP